MRESVETRVVGLRSLISCMTRNIPYRIALFMWNMIGCFMYVIAFAFRWGVAFIGKLLYWALVTPSWLNIFHVLKIHRGMKCIQDLRVKEKPRFGFVLHFVNFGWKTQFCYVKRT